MAASGYVSEDVLTSIVPLFVVLVLKLHEKSFLIYIRFFLKPK